MTKEERIRSLRTCKKAIRLIEGVSRRSIIETKLNEIKDMFDDPVTNEELIEILKDKEEV